jgi:D-alanine--D-alanine ligase
MDEVEARNDPVKPARAWISCGVGARFLRSFDAEEMSYKTELDARRAGEFTTDSADRGSSGGEEAPPGDRGSGPRYSGERLRIGLAHNLKRVAAKRAGDDDREAEFDAPTTIEAIRDAIASHGHDVVLLEATPELPCYLRAHPVDLVFNIAEGAHGRTREAQVPAMLDLLGIEYTGSDAMALTLTLDKSLAKTVVAAAGVRTARSMVLHDGTEDVPDDLRFPLVVKPLAEGSSKGVLCSSVAENERALRRLARSVLERYAQPALAEEYLPGREFTVAVLGNDPGEALPPMEIVFLEGMGKRKLYSFEHKTIMSELIRYDAPANVDEELGEEIRRVALASFRALRCRDVARFDLRLDAKGRVCFIECNPLPGLVPDFSDLCLMAKGAGLDYAALVGKIMEPAIVRSSARAVARSALSSAGRCRGRAPRPSRSPPPASPRRSRPEPMARWPRREKGHRLPVLRRDAERAISGCGSAVMRPASTTPSPT